STALITSNRRRGEAGEPHRLLGSRSGDPEDSSLCSRAVLQYHQRLAQLGGPLVRRPGHEPRFTGSRYATEAPALAHRGFLICKARWQSGHAAACKAVYAGSIPTLASNPLSLAVLPRHSASQSAT